MNTEFSLESFLKNYQPKKIDPTAYLKCPKLKKYSVLNKTTISNLILAKTYIKMVKTEDMFRDKNLPDHVRPGGILLAGGTFGEKFHKEKNPLKWTHLMLKYDPEPKKLLNGTSIKVDGKIYIIKMANYQIFYRVFGFIIRNDFEVILENYK